MVLLQETMSSQVFTGDYFLRLRPGWRVSAIDSLVLLGGTFVAWNPLLDDLNAFNSYACILLTGKFKGLNLPLHILNVYGTYANKKPF